jgi:hypothetical protein
VTLYQLQLLFSVGISRGWEDEDSCLLGCCAVWSGRGLISKNCEFAKVGHRGLHPPNVELQ